MKALRIGSIGLLLLLALVTAGCRATLEEQAVGSPPGIEGYVVEKEDGSMLVVAADRNAIRFSAAPPEAKVGQKVQVWFGEVRESYPAQAEADRVRILLSPKPYGADLSEADAIRNALLAHEGAMAPAVRSAEYDRTTDAWTVRIQSGDAETVEQVKDEG